MTITQQYVHCVEVPIRDCYIEMPIAIEVGRSNGDDGHASEIPVWLKCPVAFIQQNRESSRYVWTSASGTRSDSKVDVTVDVGNVPSPLPRSIAILSPKPSVAARSIFPSPLKSPTVTNDAPFPGYSAGG